MCNKYWLTACRTYPWKSVVRWTDCPAMTLAVDLGGKATKKKKKNLHNRRRMYGNVPFILETENPQLFTDSFSQSLLLSNTHLCMLMVLWQSYLHVVHFVKYMARSGFRPKRPRDYFWRVLERLAQFFAKNLKSACWEKLLSWRKELRGLACCWAFSHFFTSLINSIIQLHIHLRLC